jgi:protein-tyrosine sulfotransferase
MLFMPMLRRRMKSVELKYLLAWILSILVVIWFMNSTSNMEASCNKQLSKNGNAETDVEFVRLNDEQDLGMFNNYNEHQAELLAGGSAAAKQKIFPYNRNMPIIFVGGVPRSGTTLMRAMLDAHPGIRCGEETRIIPRLIYMRNQWTNSKKEAERLKNAGITEDIIDSAIGAFILEVVVKHGKPADHLCNKDPLVLRYSTYMKTVFPNGKFILMIRDGRATVHSIISRKVTITGFNLESYRDCLSRWNNIIEHMYAQCIELGPDACMPVYYEQLVLHPEKTTKNILSFLNITWNDAVLHHEKFIGNEVSLSKVERSSDQVIKPVNLEALTSWVGKIPADVLAQMDTVAPMLRRLGYDPFANPPNYGDPDMKIKENTFHIQTNKEYWKQLANKYSIHAKEPGPNGPAF